MKALLFCIAMSLALLLTGAAWAFDPEKPTYDPDLQYVTTQFGAILGDPTQFSNIGSNTTGFTHISTSLIDGMGLTVMTSLIEPAQDGKPGGGDSLLLSPDQALTLIAGLRKGPEWAEVARENAVGEYSKDIGLILGDAEGDHTKIVFVTNAESIGYMHIEKRVSGIWKKYRFSINAAQKLASSVEHHLWGMLKNQPAANPRGDEEKDKLFQ